MMKITDIWFDGEYLYGKGDNGTVYRQSLLWYPKLLSANDEERSKFEFSSIGIHWRALDEDVSFESFEYEDAEPSKLQRFFLLHKEIDISGFARSMGIKTALLRNYINGFKKPSKEMEQQILEQVHKMGAEFSAATF